jgi:thiol-disulfide isomerase/thioredoxin
MRYFIALFCVSAFLAGCIPSTSVPSNSVKLDSLQFKNNISMLYAAGSKNITDSSGNIIASNISWKDSSGITRSLTDLRGKKILLNFWATWCVYCDDELPGILNISDSLKKDIVVIGVAIDEDPSTFPTIFDLVQSFAKSRKMTFQVVVDETAKSYINYGGDGQLPWTFIIDRQGRVIQKFKGAQSEASFLNVLNAIP